MAYETTDGKIVCEQCGNEYSRIGAHWTKGTSCDHPALDRVTQDILIGSLMGDGTIERKHHKNQSIMVGWSSEEQCTWLDEQFGWFSTGVTLSRTAEEQAERKGGTEFNGSTRSSDPADWSDKYRVRTRSHPFITRMTTRWYGDSGYEKKEWPDDLDLSPTVLLLWFVGDGTYRVYGGSRNIRITLNNEEGNEEKIDRYFQKADIPAPSRWEKTDSVGLSESYSAIWNVRESKRLFEYMNHSPLMDDGVPRGFEYKFPAEYGGTGRSMADVTAK